MFKKVKHPDFIVGHRLKGANTKRDPLLDEKLGSNKRSRDEDGSSSVVYKETPEEKRARLKAEKDAEKELRDAQKRKKQGLGPSKASILGLPDPEETQEEKVDDPEAPEGEQERQEKKAKMSHKDMKDTLANFKDRLKSSKLPEQAAASEQRHKEELEMETQKALQVKEKRNQELKDKPAPDFDPRLTMNEIWKAGEGGDEEEAGWLEGGGLKFHTTADKAFSMAQQRFKDSETSVENRELAASVAKKQSELRMAEVRRGTK